MLRIVVHNGGRQTFQLTKASCNLLTMPQLYPSPSEHQPQSAFQGLLSSSHHRQTQQMVRTADSGVSRELQRTDKGQQPSPELPQILFLLYLTHCCQ